MPWSQNRFLNKLSEIIFFLQGHDTVLTAAHCIYGGESALITLGAHNFSMNEPSRIQVASQKFIIHPGYNPSELNNDLALIKLSETIQFSKYKNALTVQNLKTKLFSLSVPHNLF